MVVKWWAGFLGYLMRHAILMEQRDERLLNEDHLGTFNESGRHYVEEITKRSILDWIDFPAEGKQFFAKQRKDLYDNDEGRLAIAKLELEKILIQQRSTSSFLTDTYDGYQMDEHLMLQESFVNAKK
jgi:hypothetical protein